MARDLDASMAAELVNQVVRPAYLYKATFSGGSIYLWSGKGDLSYGGNTYLGNGYLTGWTPLREVPGTKPPGLAIELSGVPSSLRSLILNNGNTKATMTFYIAFLDSAGAIVGAPYAAFVGEMDTAEIVDDGQSPEIEISYNVANAQFDNAAELRYTSECQKIFDATDKGFDFVPQLQDWTGTWAKFPDRKKKNKRERR